MINGYAEPLRVNGAGLWSDICKPRYSAALSAVMISPKAFLDKKKANIFFAAESKKLKLRGRFCKRLSKKSTKFY